MVRNEHNTPGNIKYPFWRMTAQNPQAVYACINYGEAFAPEEIRDRSICINADIGKVLGQLLDNRFHYFVQFDKKWPELSRIMNKIWDSLFAVSISECILSCHLSGQPY